MEDKIIVNVNREAARVDSEATATKQEKLRKKFESKSLWPFISKGPFAAFFYGMFLYPRVFFDHFVMENPAYPLSIFQETMLRSAKWSMNSSLKSLRKTGSFIELLIKVFRCSEPFYPLESKVKKRIGVKEGYWLGPIEYKRRECEATILYLHGGGYVALSSLVGVRSLCYLLKQLRKRYNKHVRVLAVDYSLAPEDPFPSGLKCADKAYKWLVRSGFAGSKNVFLCGDSAGAGLVLALLQRLYPDKSTTKSSTPTWTLPLGALLLSPWVELSCDSLTFFTNAKFDWIPGHFCQFAAEYYIFGKDGNPSRRNQISQQEPKINKDKIMDWLEKVEDNPDSNEADGNSLFKRRSRKRRARKRGAKVQKSSHTEIALPVTRDPDETLRGSSEKKLKNKKSNIKENPYRNPLISPLHTSHQVLARFPPLLITYGGKEIFRDDIEMFIRKCIESKRAYKPSDDNEYVDNSSLDGQHPDVIVELDEDMIHDYPMFIDVFGKRSKKALDRIVHFIANRIPLVTSPTFRSKKTRNSHRVQSLFYSETSTKFSSTLSVPTSPSNSTPDIEFHDYHDDRLGWSPDASFVDHSTDRLDRLPKFFSNSAVELRTEKLDGLPNNTFSNSAVDLRTNRLNALSISDADLRADRLSFNSRRIPSVIY